MGQVVDTVKAKKADLSQWALIRLTNRSFRVIIDLVLTAWIRTKLAKIVLE